MPTWTLISLDTPLAGSAQRTELSMASGRKASFSLDGSGSLSFSLPGRHWQTEHVTPLTSDILLFRDDYCVQRYRVMSASYSKDVDGRIDANFTCSTYRELMNAWMFLPTHTRRFINIEQTAIAWTIINETQTMPKGALGITRGLFPVNPVVRTLDGDWEATTPQPYFYDVGKRKGEAIRELANMVSGFEWDIEPDRTNTTTRRTSLRFNTWNAGQRVTRWPRCEFILDDGGNVLSWNKTVSPSEYGNVVHGKGKYPQGIATADDPEPESWEPDDRNPGGAAPEGRWERSVSIDASSQSALDSMTAAKLEELLAYEPAWQVDLAPGRWQGPTQMWIGDYCRFVVNDGPVNADFDARVVKIDIGISDEGLETIRLDLNRSATTYAGFRAELERRLLNLERY